MNRERKLLERAKACDPEALGQLYDHYAPKIYDYFYRRVGQVDLAEDLTGELFMRLLLAVQNGQIWNQSFRAWLYRVAHNLVVDHYRSRPPLTEELEEADGVAAGGGLDEMVERKLANDRLFQGIQQLTPEQQEVLVLRYGEGLTAREVGEIIGKSTGAVEALQRRGLAGLRRIMGRGAGDGKGS